MDISYGEETYKLVEIPGNYSDLLINLKKISGGKISDFD